MGSVTRREVLARAGRAGTLLAVKLPTDATGASQSGPQPGKGRRLKVVVAGGHPRDPEYGCGGTINRYTKLGHEGGPPLLE